MSDVNEEGSIESHGFSLVRLTRETVPPFAVRLRGPALGVAGVRHVNGVNISPGDVLRVTIAESREGGLFAPLATGGTVFPAVRVNQSGAITLPYVKTVSVRGLDTTAAAARISSRLAGTTFEPQVYIELGAERASSVLVSGEVRQPGRVSLIDTPPTLLDVINRSGGAVRPPQHTDVVLRRGGRLQRIPMTAVLNGQNVTLSRGDEIVLEGNVRAFHAMGAVGKPGLQEFPKAQITLLEALSTVGGLADHAANRTGVFVFRLRDGKVGGSTVFQVDFNQADSIFIAQQFEVLPADTVFVTTAPTYQWSKIISPIVQGLSLARGATVLGN